MNVLGRISEEMGNGKIYRKNGRPCAYITISLKGKSVSASKDCVQSAIKNISMEKGYGVAFQKEIEMLQEDYRNLLLVLLICIVAIFLTSAALTENIRKSLLTISVIPASLILPIGIKFIFKIPLELADIIAMVILSGISVNNAIYIMDSKKQRVSFKIREKIRCIFATSFSTGIGAIPLLFLASDSFSKSIAFFMLFGVLNSTLVALALFPGLMEWHLEKNAKVNFQRCH